MSLRKQKTAKKKDEILQSALGLISEKGYHGTTMEDIASHLLMTKGALYYYFKDKQDLVYQSQIKMLEQSIASLEQVMEMELTPPEKLANIITVHTEYLIGEMAGFELMINPNEIYTEAQLKEIIRLRDAYADCYDQLLTEGIEGGYFLPGDVKIVRNLLLGAVNWVTQWYSPHGKMNKTEFVETITAYMMRIVQK